MPQNNISHAASQAVIAELAKPPCARDLDPIAARFIYSLRLIALHEKAKRDPVPELAMRLGNVEVAAKSLALANAISATWPEKVRVSRFCCGYLTHDEVTIGAIIQSASDRDPEMFKCTVAGFIRPAQTHRLWEAALDLVAAELRGN